MSADGSPLANLSSRIAGKSEAFPFGTGTMAPPLVPSDENFDPRQTPFGGRFGNRTTSYPAAASRGTVRPEMQQQAAPLVGLVSGKPMSFHAVQPPIWDFPNRSAPPREETDDWLTQLLRSIRSR